MLLPCPECCDERSFEQPLCIDGHGLDCPEWFCGDCGMALLLGSYPEFDLPPSRTALPVLPAHLTARTAA